MREVIVNGRPVQVPDSTTGAELRDLAHVSPDRQLVRQDNGGYSQISPRDVLQPDDGDQFVDAPRRIKGWLAGRASWPMGAGACAHERALRVEREVLLVARQFSAGVRYDEVGHHWFTVDAYRLPPRYGGRYAQLLLLIPPTYPLTAPIGFYLSEQLRPSDGHADPFFVGYGAHNAPDLRDVHWYWYCATIPGGAWRASADYRRPDNLVSFLAMAYDALSRED